MSTQQVPPGRAIAEAYVQGFTQVLFLEQKWRNAKPGRPGQWVAILRGNLSGVPHAINVYLRPHSDELHLASTPLAPVASETPRTNPRIAPIEVYDPRLEQVRAQRQAIYETTVLQLLKRKIFRTTDGKRADLLLSPEDRAQASRAMFSVGTGVPSRDLRLLPGTQKPTIRAALESKLRYEDVDHLLRNRQDYEETLALARKSGFYRPTLEYTSAGVRYFVWPLVPGQRVPQPLMSQSEAERVAAELSAKADPRATGKWWVPPSTRYTKAELFSWLPPDSVFS